MGHRPNLSSVAPTTAPILKSMGNSTNKVPIPAEITKLLKADVNANTSTLSAQA